MAEIISERPEAVRYVDWAAILAGAIVAGGASVVLTTFAGGLGLGSISVDKDGGISFGWLALTGFVAVVAMVAIYMLGGYVAGRMRRSVADAPADEIAARDGLHGLVVWGVGIISAAVLAASALGGAARAVGGVAESSLQAAGAAVGGVAQGAGQLAGGVVSGAGQALGGAAQSAAPTLDDMLPEGLRSNPVDYVIDEMARPPEGQNPAQPQDPAAAQRQVGVILANLVRTGDISDGDKAFLRSFAASRTSLPPEQVQARVDDAIAKAQSLRAEAQKKIDDAKAQAERVKAEAEQRLEQAKAQAAEIAEKTRVAGILTAFLLAASALAAAAAATIGAVRGGRHRDENRIWKGLSYNK